MKQTVTVLIAAAGFVFATGSQAADPKAAEELAKKSACMACHTLDKKLVGPSYKEVAAKYSGQKDAQAKLIDKVKKGGTGAWGQIPMPPNTNVKDEDIKTLVDWILSVK